MQEMTREEHLQWCKKRALAYLPGDPGQAVTSMFSDLGKHAETADHIGLQLGLGLLMTGNLSSPDEARRFIEGFR